MLIQFLRITKIWKQQNKLTNTCQSFSLFFELWTYYTPLTWLEVWGVGLILSPSPEHRFTSPLVETLITKDTLVGLTRRYTSS